MANQDELERGATRAMMDATALQQALTALSAQQASAQEGFYVQSERLQHRRGEVQQQMLALQQTLDEIIQEQQALPALQQATKQQFVEQEVTLLADALAASEAAIRRAFVQSQEQRNLDRHIQVLLETQQGLPEKWKNFQEFEQKREQLLSMLPAYHHAEVLESHAKLAREVEPLLKLYEQRRQLEAPLPAALTVLCLYSQDQIEVALVMPIAAHAVKGASVDPLWGQLVELLNRAFFSVGKAPEWEIAGTEPYQWSSYWALHTLAEYSGPGDAVRELETLLQQYSGIHTDEAPLPVVWQLVPLSAAAWQARSIQRLVQDAESSAPTNAMLEQNYSASEDAAHPVESLDIESLNIENEEADTELGLIGSTGLEDSWYTRADLMSWQRPLRLTTESKWSRSGRQLRTLLTRMLAKGLVEQHYVPATQLWAGLPHRMARIMETHLMRLIEREVFLVQGLNTGGLEVTLNPALLDEIQNLINRTITTFWEPMVADDAKAQRA
jgi:hypothetical protein